MFFDNKKSLIKRTGAGYNPRVGQNQHGLCSSEIEPFKGREVAMVPRILMGLVAGLAIALSASSASAAFFAVQDLGGNQFQVQLRGEAGDVATTVGDADIQDIIITGGATLVSHDQTTSIFQGKSLGPTNTIQNPTTFRVGGTDFGASTALNSASVLSLGNFTLSGAPATIELGGVGLYTSNPGFFQPAIVLSNAASGTILFQGTVPEPASLLLIGLGLSALAFARRKA